jgi:hypothetical protein
MNGTRTLGNHRVGLKTILVALAVACATGSFAQANAIVADEPATVGKLPGRQVPRHAPGAAIDERVKLLTGELNLDEGQQSVVKRLLESQREQTLHIWSNDAVPAAVRVKSTQAVSERTADQIRALLNEEQRKRYIQPRNDKVARNADRLDVEAWMRGGQAQLPKPGQ